ncbi:MAG: DUF2911 domain-containing protein, partial [Bacteroidota bacterium]
PFSIRRDGEWTIIFNKEPDQWGAYDYKESKDALRIQVPTGKAAAFTEQMTFEIDKDGQTAAKVRLLWENLETTFKVTSAQ